ncbi:protein tyrosine phosphatase [Mycobacterium sp. NAZ190054]|nr:protein tyrosine phosphatase [Mycobacterium sp. NAZ190054]
MEYAIRTEVPDFVASSAGTRAVINGAIHHEAAAVLERLGGRASSFAARQFSPRIAKDADLILTMTREHRDRVLELAPGKLSRTFTLAESSALVTELDARSVIDLAGLRPHLSSWGGRLDIRDPIGQDADVFADVGARIAELLPPVMELCRRSASDGL